MDEQFVREALGLTEQLELQVHRERDPDVDGPLMDELAMIRQALRSALGLDPFRDLTLE